jgi:hypothetical protein
MADPTPSPTPDPTPSPDPTPAPAAERPGWVPETFWDGEKKAIKEDFGQHYQELTKAQQAAAERQAALAARKPEDIKLDPEALPSDLKMAAEKAGLKIKIDENDPRIPFVRQIAVEHGLDQDVVNKLVAMDAKLKLDARTSEMERIAAEDKKLGPNVDARKKSVATWLDGLKTKGDLTAEEHEEVRWIATSAAGVTALEKIMAKATGTVPGTTVSPPPPPPPVSVADRWYSKTTAQQKVS